MSNSIEQLAQLGHEYVTRIGNNPITMDYPFFEISELNSGRTRNDGTRLETAIKLTERSPRAEDALWLDKPLFKWNGALDSPRFTSQANPIINTSECSPTALTTIATNMLSGRVPAVPEVKDRIIERIGAVFLAGATPRMLMDEFNGEVGFILKDAQYPEVHSTSANIFYGAIATQTLVAFDVHDIAHHAVQLQTWPEYYTKASRFAYESFMPQRSLSNESAVTRHLSGLVMDATLEESLISDGKQLYSFGCLNWLSPRDTPAALEDTTYQPADKKQELNQKWHALYAVKDLYRTQKIASDALRKPLDWVARLGYETDAKFIRLCEQPITAPLLGLDIYAANYIDVVAPRTADELFANASKLIDQVAHYY